MVLWLVDTGGGEHCGVEVHAEDRGVASSGAILNAGAPDASGNLDVDFVQRALAVIQREVTSSLACPDPDGILQRGTEDKNQPFGLRCRRPPS